jgi:hypothetical protein
MHWLYLTQLLTFGVAADDCVCCCVEAHDSHWAGVQAAEGGDGLLTAAGHVIDVDGWGVEVTDGKLAGRIPFLQNNGM